MLRRLWNSSTLSLIVGVIFATSLCYPTFYLADANIGSVENSIPYLSNGSENATFIFALNSSSITRGDDDLILSFRFTYENLTYIPDSTININITNPSLVLIYEETIWVNTTDIFYYIIPWPTFNGQDAGNYTVGTFANSTTTKSYSEVIEFELTVLPFGRIRMFFPSSSVTLVRNQDNEVTCLLTNIGGTTATNVTVTPQSTKTGTIGSVIRTYSITNLVIASGDFHQDSIWFYPETYLFHKYSFTVTYRTIDEPGIERSFESDPLEIIVPPEIGVQSWNLPDNVTIGEDYIIDYEVYNDEGVGLYILPEVLCEDIDFSDSIPESIRITAGTHYLLVTGEPMEDGVVSLTFSVNLEWTTLSETKWYSPLLAVQYEIISIFPQEIVQEAIKPEIVFGIVFSVILAGLAYFSRDLLLGIAKKTKMSRDRIFPDVTYMYETAVLDGSNIAWEEKSISNKPKISNIEAMINRLSRANFKKIITVADAALRYQIDEQKRLDQLVKEGAVKMLPARVDGDKFILRLAEEENGMIVSNDMFKEFREATPWIDERRIPYTILDGEVYLHPTSAVQAPDSDNNITKVNNSAKDAV